jgi:hypothetical protein
MKESIRKTPITSLTREYEFPKLLVTIDTSITAIEFLFIGGMCMHPTGAPRTLLGC